MFFARSRTNCRVEWALRPPNGKGLSGLLEGPGRSWKVLEGPGKIEGATVVNPPRLWVVLTASARFPSRNGISMRLDLRPKDIKLCKFLQVL